MNAVVQQEPRAVSTRQKNFVLPEVNIYESKDAYVLEAEIPGVSKDGLEITLEGNELTIEGHRTEEEIPGEVIYRESRSADYRRTFELDPVIDTSRISAHVHQGVLTLTLPKLEKLKPRRIEIGD